MGKQLPKQPSEKGAPAMFPSEGKIFQMSLLFHPLQLAKDVLLIPEWPQDIFPIVLAQSTWFFFSTPNFFPEVILSFSPILHVFLFWPNHKLFKSFCPVFCSQFSI
jgi:hypothetical protein